MFLGADETGGTNLVFQHVYLPNEFQGGIGFGSCLFGLEELAANVRLMWSST